ncbi:hypothetical protein [Pseudoduganella armeniaca]|uniref:Phosphoglycerate mutase n=1 Tax=Pseudoduganella armeniaca TaxID=2072590 RepID=A0A2R4CAV5_9BURK|nr:hypothetical protein [Pseudoduganella armeniaca]AVR96725.1 hypothetical protein C9I28_14360 [Pseudoduganella armeniaca]
MPATTLIVPFALPPAPMAPDLIRALQAPALAALLSRHAAQSLHAFEADSRVLPHEAWVAHALELAGAPAAADAGAPMAPAVMAGHGMAPAAGHWFLVHPVAIHVGSHLQMADPRQLQLSEEESRTLFDAVLPLFTGDGHELVYADAHNWFLRADAWAGLDTASPDAAFGDNLHAWMPRGDMARAFRRLQNEVQMLWFAHPLNAARQGRGQPPINSFWLWGGADAARRPAPNSLATAAVPDWLARLAAPERRAAAPAQLRAGDVVVAGAALAAGLAEDWGLWLEAMARLEQDWFAPLLAAQRAGSVGEVTLVLTHRHGWLQTRTSKMAQYRFWRPVNLNPLQTPLLA